MGRIDIKQISNFPDIPTQEQVDVLYVLLNKLILQLEMQGIELDDEFLQAQLNIALKEN